LTKEENYNESTKDSYVDLQTLVNYSESESEIDSEYVYVMDPELTQLQEMNAKTADPKKALMIIAAISIVVMCS